MAGDGDTRERQRFLRRRIHNTKGTTMNITIPAAVSTKARSVGTKTANAFTKKPSKKAVVIASCVAGVAATASGVYLANPQMVARGLQVTRAAAAPVVAKVTSDTAKAAAASVLKRASAEYVVGVGIYGAVNTAFDAIAAENYTFKDGAKSFGKGSLRGATSMFNIVLSTAGGFGLYFPRMANTVSWGAVGVVVVNRFSTLKTSISRLANDLNGADADFVRESNVAWKKYVAGALEATPDVFSDSFRADLKFTNMTQGDMNAAARFYVEHISASTNPATVEQSVREDFAFASKVDAKFVNTFAFTIANAQHNRTQSKKSA